MTTCSRCGKENQKHYKFCLGCGAKLEAPAAAVGAVVAPAVEPVRPLETTRPSEAARPIEHSRSSDMPARTTGASMAAAVPMAEPAAAPPPMAAELAPTAETPIVRSTSNVPRASGAMAVSAAPNLDQTPPVGQPPLGSLSKDLIPCPKCGKPVIASYAFCGACGYRMKPGGAGAAPAPAARTIAQSSSNSVARTAPRGHLTLIRPDGTEGGVHPLQDGENLIGRGQGSLFDADPYLSPRHAEFAFTDEGLVVRDLRSLNGVFIKIVAEERLESGDVLRIGQELLRFNVIAPPIALEDGTDVIGTPNPGYWGRLSVIVGRDVEGPAFPLYDEMVVLGRERGDILFPEDGYVSGRHAQISYRDGYATLTDLGSSNGTFFRIRGSRSVPAGTLLLMGQQLFRASYR